MLTRDERDAVLRVLEREEYPSPLLRRAMTELKSDVCMSVPRSDLPFHLGGCTCKPGECRK